ncbi:survival motor neuron protein-like isoform X1 [Falco biarmicus]|uniref:survival motor neuron protein-like isoform X1 n=1 Tax=Falco biarmicus TaxID=345155 RepID=UPI0024BC73EF|nr:survival motor neuron protein-like isoform X1 [Falco biarmicus]XP_056194213.1 survival motor neuron protein-like isoform X1 [Falco biarmicus]
MAERAPGPRGPDPQPAGPSSGKAAIPGATLPRSPRDTPAEGSDGDSETPTSSVTHSEQEQEDEAEEGHQWRVGDACTTTWAGDGLLYPAHLWALDRAAGTCLVEFDGYGNTEERALADLLPPRPGAWRARDAPRGQNTPSAWEPPPRTTRRKGERVPCSPRPPECPPALLHALQEEEEEEDALAAMLMAWYMSGYHTGFYVGLREGRTEAAEPPPQPGHRQKKPPRH